MQLQQRKRWQNSKILSKNNINFFRGSENNVTKRVHDCAKKFNSKIIVQLTGDNPTVDHRIIDKALKIFKDNDYDFVTNNCLEIILKRLQMVWRFRF